MGMTTSAMAQEVVRVLAASLPSIIFQVYVPRLVMPDEGTLYVFGFLRRDVLIGGYRIDALLVPEELELHLVHASLFFDIAWAVEVPRF